MEEKKGVVQKEMGKKEQKQEMKMLQSWARFTSSPISQTAAPIFAMAASSLRKRYVSSSLFLSRVSPSLFFLSLGDHALVLSSPLP